MTASLHEKHASQAAELGNWYHRVELPSGYVTPGDRDQSLVYDLFASYLPADLTGLSVLDLGANAAGLSVEFAKRGASVLAVELDSGYRAQAEFVIQATGLADRIQTVRADIYSLVALERRFDIVAFVGLSYHLRYPQLALDMLSRHCGQFLLASSQTIDGDGLSMSNRAARRQDREPGTLFGWEPTEQLYLEMLGHAGFTASELVSTAPHPGEQPGRWCGNRSYYFARSASEPRALPFIDGDFVGKPSLAGARLEQSRDLRSDHAISALTADS